MLNDFKTIVAIFGLHFFSWSLKAESSANLQLDKIDIAAETTRRSLKIAKTADLQKMVQGLENLSFKSQLSLKSKAPSFPGRLTIDWQQCLDSTSGKTGSKQGNFKIFHAFLSEPVLHYSFSKQHMRFSAYGVEPIEDNSEAKIFERVAENHPKFPIIPLEHLIYWIFGISSPTLDLKNVEQQPNGLINKMEQFFGDDIWILNFTYPEMGEANAYPLPQKICISHPRSEVVFNLTISNFDVDAAFYQKFIKNYAISDEFAHL